MFLCQAHVIHGRHCPHNGKLATAIAAGKARAFDPVSVIGAGAVGVSATTRAKPLKKVVYFFARR